MYDLDIILREILSKEEIIAIKIYSFLNQEILHKSYEVTEKELEVIIRFFTNGRENTELDAIWTRHSVQREAFKTALLIVENLKSSDFDTQKIERGLYNDNNLFLKSIIRENLEYILDLCKNLKQEKIDPLLLKENYYSIYKIGENERDLTIDFEKESKYIYVLVRGNIRYDNKVYLERSIFYSETYKEFIPIGTGEFLVFLISLKSEFFKVNNIELSSKAEGKSYFIPDLSIIKILNKILKNKENSLEKDRILIQEMIYYFIDTLNGFKYNLINMKELELKKIIVDTINKNIEDRDKEIVEKLTNDIGISLSKLYKLFDELYKETPGNYIRNVKLKKVYRDLTLTNIDMEDLSYSVGYSYKYLTKLVLEETGYRLNELRKYLRRK